MKRKELEELTLYLYNDLSKNIENGLNNSKLNIDIFTDPRGGFIARLIWSEYYIKNHLTGKNHETAYKLLTDCYALLKEVKNKGWTTDTKSQAKTLVAKLKNQKWHYE
ncbi:hypothetical protein [Zooshikella harenae]|uniref:Uncharacterized protein n=1 Tax=Zooshikella harenae TaxID=2827238 RepID=A0ABS5ZII3_9GAMM|nr:hypothetical protein [Zooshikella harenae]MBU2713887.1 hypothetical protein [Zooshikella harenae]